MLAISSSRIGLPASSLLVGCGFVRSLLLRPKEFPLLSRALSHAQAIAFQAAPFVTVRWEEGWEGPLAEWREELGVFHPADHEPCGLGEACR